MLIVALALAVIGLAALVTAVVTSNEIVAWVCIAASTIGVILLVVDAVRERQAKRAGVLTGAAVAGAATTEVIDGAGDTEVIESIDTDDAPDADAALDADAELEAEIAVEDHPEEVVHDEPEYDTYSDDEPEYPPSAEESALHGVTEDEGEAGDGDATEAVPTDDADSDTAESDER
jgi:hypothetical protein